MKWQDFLAHNAYGKKPNQKLGFLQAQFINISIAFIGFL
jgi:hypothetical protein